MKRIKLLLLSAFVCVGLSHAFAQTKVSGQVTSSEDGQPIPGVTVIVKGLTGIGTTTNIDGKYVLTVPANGKILEFSYVGMITQDIPISGQSTINVILQPDSKKIDEVVVTAMGIKKSEKSVGYSATTVKSNEIENAQASTAMTGLQGKVAGMVVSTGGGAPGSSTKVILRGYSNISGGNNPLYVIDGVPIDNNTRTSQTSTGIDFGNRADDVNPNDIESMTVLKGAAATALYGSRAANGAIMITTKSGKKADRIKVDVSSSVTFTTPLRIPKFQNTFGQGWSGLFSYDENGSWGPKMDGQMRLWGNVYEHSQQIKPFAPVKKNLRDFYDVGHTYLNNVSIQGGGEKTSFYLSYSNATANGMIPTDIDKSNRNTFSFRGMAEGKFLKVNAVFNYVHRTGSQTPDGNGGTGSAANLFSEILQIPRDISIVDLKNLNNPFNSLDYYFTPYAVNPYYALENNNSEFKEDRIYGNIDLNVKFTDYLSLLGRIGTDVSTFRRSEHEAIMTFTPGTPQANKKVAENPGMVFENSYNESQINADIMLNFNKKIGERITIDAMIGANLFERQYRDLNSSISSLVIPGYYNLSNTSGTPTTATDLYEKRMLGLYGSANVGYKNFIFLNFTARNDWSSTLPKDNNNFFYPAVNLSFIPSEILDLNFLTFLKIRGSWGQVGSDAPAYSLASVFIPGDVDVPFGEIRFPIKGVPGYELSNQIGNPGLKPVISSEWEVGLDGRLWNGRLFFDAAYYNKLSDGQILAAPIAPSSGYNSQIINFGKIENKGVELLFGGVPVQIGGFKWEISATFTKNKNKVISLPGPDQLRLTGAYSVDFVAKKDYPLGVFQAPDYTYVDGGKILVNAANGIPIGSTNPTIIGNAQLDYMLGISNKFSYKGIELGGTFDIREGGYMYSGIADLHYFVGNATQTTYNERQPFIVPNSVVANPKYVEGGNEPQYIENTTAIDMNNINAYYYTTQNSAANRLRVIPKSYIKLREVYLLYTLPANITKKLKLSNLQVNITGRNLFLWTPAKNNFIDPEVTSFGNDLTGDFGEFRSGPTSRYFTVGLKFGF